MKREREKGPKEEKLLARVARAGCKKDKFRAIHFTRPEESGSCPRAEANVELHEKGEEFAETRLIAGAEYGRGRGRGMMGGGPRILQFKQL